MICAMTMICFWASTCWSCDPSEKSWNQLEYIRIQCEISQDPASIQFSFKLANETQSSMEQHGYIYIYIHASLHGGVTLTPSLEANANDVGRTTHTPGISKIMARL